MMLTQLENVSLAYGPHTLLSRVGFHINAGEKVCLVGRNGTGKSSLFRIIAGESLPDEGTVWYRDGLKVSYLEQDATMVADITVYDMVASGLGTSGQVLSRYHQVAADHAMPHDEQIRQLADLQHQIESLDGWSLKHKIDTVIDKLSLPGDRAFSDCSGGIRRQVLLAKALVSDPDLLLLDEPTNHMDITAITWIESFLQGFRGGLLFITHDRTFLKNLATRIVELDRGKLTSFNGDYDFYLRRKDEMLNAETKANERFDKQLAEHEVWIRQGIKARRTRNEGRVTLLENMRRERAQRSERQGVVSLQLDSGETSGKRVADLRHVNFSYGDKPIINNLTTRIMRGDRVGIIGPNGSGKSTLLKLMLGELPPDSGQVILGTGLQIAYFDQQRNQLDLEKTVRDNISEGNDFISVQGQSRHIISYLKDFLFPPDRINTPVKVLSGGERNRLLLARLFTRPANLLVLDEPTNDLDVDTLELLEELLSEFTGTLLLVSHDRSFLDNIVTSTLVFEEDGRVGDYVGGYADWLRQRRPVQKSATRIQESATVATPAPAGNKTKISAAPAPAKRKLGYKEKRELEALPARIEALEKEQASIETAMSQGTFYQQDKDTITRTLSRLEVLRAELTQRYARWEELENDDG